jgi:hypothetical protein
MIGALLGPLWKKIVGGLTGLVVGFFFIAVAVYLYNGSGQAGSGAVRQLGSDAGTFAGALFDGLTQLLPKVIAGFIDLVQAAIAALQRALK